jgi:peptide deformylase
VAILTIKKYPEQVLKAVAKEVTEITPSLLSLANDMLETMYAAPGVGLAAPQVGYSLRLCVIDTRYRDSLGKVDVSDQTELERAVSFPLKLFNPKILNKDGKTTFEEGCLSVPGYAEAVPRAKYVEFEALGIDGKKILIKTDGLLAVCIQHEIDHLDGKLFIDRLSTIKRSLIKSKIKKHGLDGDGVGRDGQSHAL